MTDRTITGIQRLLLLAALSLVFALGSFSCGSKAYSVTRLDHPDRMTLPELRLLGPTNPLNPSGDGSYREHRRTYCELGLLMGVKCTNAIQVHHMMVPDDVLTELGFPELEEDPRNLVTTCAGWSPCPCGMNCHFTWWHNGDFRSTDKVLTRVMEFKSLLVEWVTTGKATVKMEDRK